MDEEINLLEYVEIILKNWKKIVVVTIVVTLFAFIYSIRQKPIYEARTTILMMSGGGASGSSYGGLAGLVGINLPSAGGRLGDLIELLQSKAVAAKVVGDLGLRTRIEGWDDPEIADHKLASSVRGMLKEPKAKGNLVELSVESTDAKLATEIANSYSSALSYYWNELNLTEAQKKREYIEGQLPRVRKELEAAERKIKAFSLLGVKASSIEFQRLQREFDIQNDVYTMLCKEYEAVKLEESKEIQPFSVVDKAVVPESPINRSAKKYTLLGFAFGILLGVSITFFHEYWGKFVKERR